jgi:hypothetical protein
MPVLDYRREYGEPNVNGGYVHEVLQICFRSWPNRIINPGSAAPNLLDVTPAPMLLPWLALPLLTFMPLRVSRDPTLMTTE